MASRAEWFTIILRERFTADEVRQRLEGRLPKGIRVTFVEEQLPSKRHPQPVVEVFTLRYLAPEEKQPTFIDAWRTFAACEAFEWTRDTKKGQRTGDIRPLFRDITFEDDGSLTLRLDWTDFYMSPLALARAVFPEAAINELAMTKLEQHFEPA